MNNITSNSFKRYSYFPSSVPKTESKEAKKKRSSFYDDYLERSNQNKQETGISINRPVLKSPDLTPQKTQTVLQNPETTGSAIKKNIESVLSKKYGELDTRHIFDGIDDKDIEDNLETAENTIKTNIDRGALSKNILPKLPNLRDGLALSYAAANKGNNKAATRAREAAYTESDLNLPRTNTSKVTNLLYTPDMEQKPVNLLLKNTGNNDVVPIKYSNKKGDQEKNKKKEKKDNSFWDIASSVLAAASFIPGADTVTNLLSIPVDLIKGDYVSAGLDALGMIPFIGEVADVAKFANKADDMADIVKAAKNTDNLADAVKVGDKAYDVTNVTAKFNENISPYKIEPTHSLTLSKNKYAELVDDIKKNGITEPIKYVEHNGTKYVVDGHHRLQAAKDLKLKDIPVEKVSLPYKGYKNISDLEWYN